MSDPGEAHSRVSETQETYCEGDDEGMNAHNESQNDSQNFKLVDSQAVDESMTEKVEQPQDEEVNPQTSLIESTNSQLASETSQLAVDDDTIATNEKDKTATNQKIEIEATKMSPAKEDENFDEDEVIQGTPPRSYSPSTKRNIDIASLKRKAKIIDEPPAKIARSILANDTASIEKELEEEEESCRSYESDNSQQELLKNTGKNVIIEETQDLINVEVTEKIPEKIPEKTKSSATEVIDTPEFHAEDTDQQQDEVSKTYDIENKENLNVSAKSTDVSSDDSIVVNINSNENSQVENNRLLGEIKEEVASMIIVIADDKPGIGTNDTESVKNKEIPADEKNEVKQSNCINSTKKTDNDNDEVSSSQSKSRVSVELIYEGANEPVPYNENKSDQEVVQIDDDDENIVLDSSTEIVHNKQGTKIKPEVVQIDESHEDEEKFVTKIQATDRNHSESKSSTDYSYKSVESMKESSLGSKDTKLTNGSSESKKCDSDVTLSLGSDTLSLCEEQNLSTAMMTTHNKKKKNKCNSFASKDMDIDIVNVSDNETSNVEEKNKSGLAYNSMTKTVQVERDIGVYLKLKCVMHMDENTKEIVSKELSAVQCESVTIEPLVASRQKNEDSQSSLADISDNKDSPPGSVNSNVQPYQLNPSRLSLMSTLSSSSSASSAASLAVRLALKSGAHLFPMPVGPAKHAKKTSHEMSTTDKQALDETYDRFTREWKNHRLLTTTVLNYVNAELGSVDTFANVSNERLDDHHLEKNNMLSSTPSDEIANVNMESPVTSKSIEKNDVKRVISKLSRWNFKINTPKELNKYMSITEAGPSSSKRKVSETENAKNKLKVSEAVLADDLIGKMVFAKWSDNNYYPGRVTDRLKTKYKVNFCDGKNKTLIPEFVIPIPKILKEGLSVYAISNTNDYGSCGIIVNSETSDGNTYYTVETDDNVQLQVRVQEIFLSADQAQVLKEEVNSTDMRLLLNSPKTLGQLTLDNMVDGQRRSKRITGTPVFSTPKSKSRSNAAGTSTPSSTIKAEPSVSGMSGKRRENKKTGKRLLLENENLYSSDSNVEMSEIQDNYYTLMGIQEETFGTSDEQCAKGPPNRIKSKSGRRKKLEDPQIIATHGPIPRNPNIFKGMSFILTYAPSKLLHRYLEDSSERCTKTNSNVETEGTETDFETEYEDDWDQHFKRDRLQAQIISGGGKVYDDFEQVPKEDYSDTILITNVPNTTAKSILCLSVGIRVCNHKWIIRCCTEEKLVSLFEYALPNGWSFEKKLYIERFQAGEDKPLLKVIVIIPNLTFLGQFVAFWRQVCENAGAVVLIAEDSVALEETTDFDSDIVIVSNQRCPSWVINGAARLKIPVLSTMWVVQCIIEGRRCLPDQHPCYKYNYVFRKKENAFDD
ncbi:hypothetical protein PUN28_007802 [Cardiocondyla obscurior]|uniref:BRCT domain-containing protein n=1 Tax=Cardiocondyla obscurior TaxID=286306 RepID=A0AAW2FUZ0_9HYME